MEKMKDLDTICTMKERLVEALHTHISQGINNMDAKEAGEVADMIKDLAEAERNCYEACYYKTVIKAMEEGDDEEAERFGYNSNRSMRTGRYISGRGGYRPYMDQMPYIDAYLNDPGFKENMRMGYPMSMPTQERYGKAYNEYRNSRRHYTATNSEHDRDEMNAHATEHVGDTISTIRDIWKSADPELKRRMKADFTNLVGEMTI